jgi:hypothetical protein
MTMQDLLGTEEKLNFGIWHQSHAETLGSRYFPYWL